MMEIFIFLRGLAMGLMLSLILTTSLLYPRHYAARLLILLCCGISGYIVAPLLYQRTDWFYLAGSFSDTIPLVFLLFAQAIFADHARPTKTSLLIGALYLFTGYAASWIRGAEGLTGTVGDVLWLTSRSTILVVMVYSLVMILRQWREDLVQPRRLLRLVVTAVVCGYILGVVTIETSMGGTTIPLWLETLHSAGIVLSSLVFSASLVILGPQQLVASNSSGATAPGETSPADQLEMDAIIAAMEVQHLYRDMTLTIRRLAEQLSIPEHRLRGHINRQLGYRNFSDFLNRYRIAETRRRLRTTEEARIPVLTIAMDAGYRSMTTFNKAFKAMEGQTPKEYRKKHLSEA
jgi:AraC-like DNA-binding protein